MLSSSSSTDFEYLRNSQGSIYLENVLNQTSTEFLNKDKFVSVQSVIGSTSFVQKWHKLPNLCGCGHNRATLLVFLLSLLKEEKEGDEYELSADHRYVAIISNYSKVPVDSFHFSPKASAAVSWGAFLFVSYQLWRHSFTATYWLYDRGSE